MCSHDVTQSFPKSCSSAACRGSSWKRSLSEMSLKTKAVAGEDEVCSTVSHLVPVITGDDLTGLLRLAATADVLEVRADAGALWKPVRCRRGTS